MPECRKRSSLLSSISGLDVVNALEDVSALTFEKVEVDREEGRGFRPWLRLYETNLHSVADISRDFSPVRMSIPHLPCNIHVHSRTHTRNPCRCTCRRVRYRLVYLTAGYLTIPSVLTQFSRSTRGVASALLANRWDDQTSIAETIGSRDHPTMPRDRLTQLTGVYRHTDTSGHVMKFMAIFKNPARYIRLPSHRNNHKFTYFREVTSNPQPINMFKLVSENDLSNCNLTVFFYKLLLYSLYIFLQLQLL